MPRSTCFPFFLLLLLPLVVLSGETHAHGNLGHIKLPCPARGKPRVRREWRSLSKHMRTRVIRAMWTMRNLTTDEGRAKYGPDFISYEDIVLQHACTNVDPRCDQGHFGPVFVVFHRAMMLEYEQSIRAVDPMIEAIPYWNVALDAADGKYRHDPDNYIFSDSFFGSKNGDRQNGFALSDGPFAFWPVDLYNSSRHGPDAPNAHYECLQQGWFRPKPASVCRRCCGRTDRCVCNRDDDVFDSFLREHDECMPYTVRNYEQFPLMDGTRELLFVAENFDRCTDPTVIRTFAQWQRCIELERSACFFPHGSVDVSKIPTTPGDAKALDIKLKTLAYLALENQTCAQQGYYDEPNGDGVIEVNAHHSQVHFKLAGDMKDPATSPNDPIFNSYHADVDRNAMTWMARPPFLERQYWHFPKHVDDTEPNAKAAFSGPFNVFHLMVCAGSENKRTIFNEYESFKHAWIPGTTLNDIVNEGFPFFNLFNETCRSKPYTARDIIEATTMTNTDYTYDTLEHLYDNCESDVVEECD